MATWKCALMLLVIAVITSVLVAHTKDQVAVCNCGCSPARIVNGVVI